MPVSMFMLIGTEGAADSARNVKSMESGGTVKTGAITVLGRGIDPIALPRYSTEYAARRGSTK